MKHKINLLDWNLRQKIILHILVIGILTASLLAFTLIATQKNILNELNRQRSDLVSSMIRCNIIYLMHQKRAKEVPVTFQRLIINSQIKKIQISDLEGHILKSSEAHKDGSLINESARKDLTRFFSDPSDPDIFDTILVSPTRSYLAIENESQCLECHTRPNAINSILIVDIDDSRTRGIMSKNKLKSAIIAFAALVILIFVIVRLFERIINKPISHLKEQMKKIQNGDLEVNLKPKKKDEIGDLTLSLNTMVKNLKEANDEIEKLHNQQIERAGHLASVGELAAGLAHEIKNPIAGVKGALEVIKEEMLSSDPRIEIFSEMVRQVDRIHELVQDLLKYARPKKIQKRMIDPNIPIEEALKMAKLQTSQKEISFEFDRLADDVQVFMDGNKIHEVILNLLVNSISAIDDKGDITISLKLIQKDHLEIIVKDTGVGISKAKLDQIFNPFFTTKKTGTGLGLSICDNIIREHQGRIDVKSQEGKGTVFRIILPLNSEN